MKNLIDFCKRELILAGMDPDLDQNTENSQMGNDILNVLKILVDGSRHPQWAEFCFSSVLTITQGLPLSPLTGDDEEWSLVGQSPDSDKYINNRCNRVFKDVNRNTGATSCYQIDRYIFIDSENKISVKTENASRFYIIDWPYTPTHEYVSLDQSAFTNNF